MSPIIVHPIKYSSDELLHLRKAVQVQGNELLNEETIENIKLIDNYCKKTRKRGKRGGIRNRLKKRGYRIPLPSVVLSNVQSLNNKLIELHSKTEYLSEFRFSSAICLTETWLNDSTPSSTITPQGFTLIRADRDPVLSNKQTGGGCCILINDKWSTNNLLIDKFCSPKLEYLVVRCRPFYLPREISCINFVLVYLPEGYDRESINILHELIADIETKKPDSAILVLGDFNEAKIRLPGYHQYVTCTTRQNKTLDLCYCNIKDAYKCTKRDPLGISDHHTIVLSPRYKQRLKRIKPTVKTIKVWNEDAEVSLQGCFDCTDWEVFYESSNSIEELVDVISEYILFCEDTVVPTKTVKIYPNNKPWFNNNIKQKLIQKRTQTSLSQDRSLLKDIQQDIDNTIEASKNEFKKKLEEQFENKSTKEAWKGLENITKYKKKSASLPDDDGDLVNKLNKFYARFDETDNSKEIQDVKVKLNKTNDKIVIEPAAVLKYFNKLNIRKSKGPDGVTPKLLKICSVQLSPIYAHIFQLCVDDHIPSIWKTATTVPVPKKAAPQELNDYRPISLTSVPFKTLERIIQDKLRNETSDKLDKLQFSYQKNRSVEDATLTLTNLIYEHLEKPNTYARTLFIDFSSAFNTIKPHILIEKLLELGASHSTCLFVLDFMTERKQYVKIDDKTSSTLTINTGSPQGCVLSALLFILYTNHLTSQTKNCHIIKYADDTAIVGLISNNNEDEYFKEIQDCKSWCDNNNLLLNAKKTKELIIDFRKKRQLTQADVTIDNNKVDKVESFKYLGTTIDNKLTWSEHNNSNMSKFQQRLYFVRFLKSFNIEPKILHMFYTSIVESVIMFNLVTYWSNLNNSQKDKINTLQMRARRVTGTAMIPIEDQYDARCTNKTNLLLKDTKHPLHSQYVFMRSGIRLRLPSCRCSRYRNSFVPNSISLYNSKH